MGLPETGRVLGVDVGYSESKTTTAACILSWTATTVKIEQQRLPLVSAQQTEALNKLVGSDVLLAAAFDGPVRDGLDVVGEYRDAEMILTRGLQRSIGKPGQASSGNGKKLNEAANQLAQAVLATGKLAKAEHIARIHEKALVEAFPTTFLGVMLDENKVPPHGPRSDAYFEHLLGPESPRPALPQTNRLAGLLELLI